MTNTQTQQYVFEEEVYSHRSIYKSKILFFSSRYASYWTMFQANTKPWIKCNQHYGPSQEKEEQLL